MKHFLITRFNLKNKTWAAQENDIYVSLTNEWLDNRFELFNTYCLPSVKNQSNQNFFWFIFFDKDTPEAYKNMTEEIAGTYPNFIPVFIDGFEELEPSLNKRVISMTDKNEFVITTRLDNDDIIHRDFIKTIQELFVPQVNTVIDLRLGYQLILSENFENDIRIYKSSFNPFISVISNLENLETCISQEHSKWKKCPNIIINDKKYLWIQLIHKKNKLNKKLRSLKKVHFIDASSFGFNKSIVSLTKSAVAFYNYYMLPYRFIIQIKGWLKQCVSSS